MSVLSVSAEPILGHIRPDIAIVSSLGARVVGQYEADRVFVPEQPGLGVTVAPPL